MDGTSASSVSLTFDFLAGGGFDDFPLELLDLLIMQLWHDNCSLNNNLVANTSVHEPVTTLKKTMF